MYIVSTVKVFNVYCCKDYNYFHLFTAKDKVIKQGEIVTVEYTKYEMDNMDKVVSYDYIIKNDGHHIKPNEFSEFFMTLNKRRQELVKKILK